MTLKPVPIFWSRQGYFNYRHHHEPRVQLHVPKKETFPIPLKNIDVARSTCIDLDVLPETRIDDYWNVDSGRNLSNSWTGFTKFTLLRETSIRIHVVRGQIDKDSNNHRPDHVCQEVRTKNGKAAQNREKRQNNSQHLTMLEN